MIEYGGSFQGVSCISEELMGNIFWRAKHRISYQTQHKQPKNIKNAFLACLRAYVWQPHGHIGWATSMPFASINPINPRTNLWNFYKWFLRIDYFENLFFWVGHLEFFFSCKDYFFCFIPMKIGPNLYGRIKDQEGKDRRRQLLCYVSLIRACNKVL